jgi:hypothetical protein
MITEWCQGRYRITREPNPKGWLYNWTIYNLTTRDGIAFMAQHGYLEPWHSETEIKERWLYQTVPIEKRRRLAA